MLIAPKRLKLRISNFTRAFPGTVRKGSWPGSRVPLNFWSPELITQLSAAEGQKVGVVSSCDQICNSHFFTYFFAIFNDRPLKFYTKLKREEYKRFIYTMAHKAWWVT